MKEVTTVQEDRTFRFMYNRIVYTLAHLLSGIERQREEFY